MAELDVAELDVAGRPDAAVAGGAPSPANAAATATTVTHTNSNRRTTTALPFSAP
ncbi:hypothetical protein [Flexivirga alba]|uniref:Uncharacterized protein n=1 Tax=Flexivirga alba TaxID=702742 RepID=A0ABW2ADR4_9MICO